MTRKISININYFSFRLFYLAFILIGLNPLMSLMALEETHGVRSGSSAFPQGSVRLVYYGIWMILTMICFIRCACHPVRSFKVLISSPFWALLLVWCLMSLGWSQSVPSTLIQMPFLLGIFCFAIFAASDIPAKEQRMLLFWALAIYAVGSAILVWLKPEVGTMHGYHEGAFQGLSGHKNFLGRYMGLCCILSILLIVDGLRWERFAALAAAFLSGALMLGSRSATGLMATVATLGALVMMWVFVGYKKWFWGLLATSAAGLIGAWYHQDKVLSMLGRQSNLTGRVPLWQALLDQVWKNSDTGYGYGAFWVAGTNPYESAIASIQYKQATHAHNGYLDVLLETGVVGLALFLFAVISELIRGIRLADVSKRLEDLWMPATLFFFLVANLTDSFVFTRPKDAFTIIMLSICFTLTWARNRDRV